MFRVETTFWLQCDFPHEDGKPVLSPVRLSLVEAVDAAKRARWKIDARHKCPAHKEAPE